MASYGEKYYANVTRSNGTTVRLSVQRRSYSGTAFQIAGLQSLTLEVGGGNTLPYTPIVKTTARFTVVDANDVGSTTGGVTCVTIENGTYIKHGQWEEFYTNDPTLYRIQISAGGAVIWTGFVTPDSWEESMIYRGSITVVARDMLGTLQDVTFSYNGDRISLASLVSEAFAASKCAMSLDYSLVQMLYNTTARTSIINARFNCVTFADKSWWSVLTSVLEALGMVLRYNGHNTFKLTSLRDMFSTLAGTRHNCEFVNRSGVRTLDPPVRDISSSFNLEFSDGAIKPINAGDLTQTSSILTYAYIDNNGAQGYVITSVGTAEVPSSNTSEWQHRPTSRPSILHKISHPAHSSLIDAGFTGFSDMYFVANAGGDYGTTFFNAIGDVSMKPGVVHSPIRLVIQQDGSLLTTDGNYMYLARGVDEESVPELKTIELYIRCTATNNTVYHYNGSDWVTGNEKTNDLYSDGLEPIQLLFENGVASLNIAPPAGVTLQQDTFVVCVTYVGVRGFLDANKPHNGIVVPLSFSIAEPSSSGLATKYSVITKYNDDYNVRINRAPDYGSIDTVLPGRLFMNAILDSVGNAFADTWGWYGDTTGYPLEVMVQAQLLMHYATALSIFTGILHDKADRTAIPGYGFTYYNRNCMLLRGTYDFTSGFMRNVAIREYKTWTEVWGSSFNPVYTIRKTRGSGGSGGGGASGGGGGGGTGGGTVTSVAMTVPTGLQVSGSPILTSGTLAVSLASGYTIPTSANVTKGVTAYGWGNHANAGYLTSIDATMINAALGFTLSGTSGASYNLATIYSNASKGATAYGWGNHANAGYLTSISYSDVTSALGFTPASTTDVNNLSEDVTVLQEKVGAIEDIIEELGDPRCLSAPKLQIIRGYSHYNGSAITPKFILTHPLIGKTGVQIVLMMWRRRRVRNPYRSMRRPNARSGWGEARGPLATSTALVTNAGYAGQTSAIVTLDSVREWVLRRYLCSYEIPKANFATMQLSTFRGYDPTQRSFAFGQLFPADMPSAQRPTEAAWKQRTKRWRQFGFAIRYENPKWTALELTNVAETTREVEDPQHQGRKIQRYIYSEVVPFKMFCLCGTKDARAQTDKWELGFEIGGVK